MGTSCAIGRLRLLTNGLQFGGVRLEQGHTDASWNIGIYLAAGVAVE